MKGILFSTAMVKAILENRKSQTRRVIKTKYSNTHIEYRTNKYGTQLVEMQNNVEGETFGKNDNGTSWKKLLGYRTIKCPYKVGDVLYVRETWDTAEGYYIYKADCDDWSHVYGITWRPSLFMPKKAARLFLKVLDVRIERLQEITEDDVIAEGVKDCGKYIEKLPPSGDIDIDTSIANWHIVCFWDLWTKINEKRGISWNQNPWVWRVSFEKCEGEI